MSLLVPHGNMYEKASSCALPEIGTAALVVVVMPLLPFDAAAALSGCQQPPTLLLRHNNYSLQVFQLITMYLLGVS